MVGPQHIQVAQTGLCMLASIKKWVITHYGMLVDSVGTSKILLALNASPANKCQHKFQPG